jgi:hypothetical protein
MPLDSLPFPKIADTARLAGELNSYRREAKISGAYLAFQDKYCTYDRGDNAVRLINAVFRADPSGIESSDCSENLRTSYELVFLSNLNQDSYKDVTDRFLCSSFETILAFKHEDFNEMTAYYIKKFRDFPGHILIVPARAPFSVTDILTVLWHRATGLCKKRASGIFRRELRRLIPNVNIHKISDFSGDPHFANIAELVTTSSSEHNS